MPERIQAVIFDFGGVLTLPPTRRETEQIAQLCGLSLRRYRREWRRERGQYDRGTLSAKSYWEGVLAAGGNGREPQESLLQELMQRDFAGWSRTNEATLAWARELASAGLSTAILSNMPPEALVHMRGHLPWLEEFPVSVFSCEVGMIKPEEGIFSACLRALGSAPEQTLFVDDHPPNVRAARALGMAALRFQSAERLRRAAAREFALGSRG